MTEEGYREWRAEVVAGIKTLNSWRRERSEGKAGNLLSAQKMRNDLSPSGSCTFCTALLGGGAALIGETRYGGGGVSRRREVSSAAYALPLLR